MAGTLQGSDFQILLGRLVPAGKKLSPTAVNEQTKDNGLSIQKAKCTCFKRIVFWGFGVDFCFGLFFLLFNYILPQWGGGGEEMLKIVGNLKINFSQVIKEKCMKVLVSQSHPTFFDPLDCNPPGSSAHGILQAGILEYPRCSLLQGIFPTQGLNPGLPHCRLILYPLSYQMIKENVGNSTNIFSTLWNSLKT